MANKKSIGLELRISTIFQNVDQAINKLQNQLKSIDFSKSFSGTSFNSANDYKTKLADFQKELQDVMNFKPDISNLDDYQNKITQLENKFQELSQSQKDFSNLKIDVALPQDYSKDIVDAKDAQSQLADEIKKASDNIDAYQRQWNALSKKQKKFTQGQNIKQQLEDEIQKRTDLQNQYNTQSQLISDLENKQQDYTKSLQEQQAATQAQVDSNKEIIDSEKQLKELNEKSQKLSKALIKEKEEETKEKEKAAREAEKLAKAEEKVIETVKKTGDSFQTTSKYSNNLTSAIQEQIIKWTSFRAIVNFARKAVLDIIQTYKELDDNLSAISAVSGISTQNLWGDMPNMIDNANNLALSINDLTDGMLTLYQQGLNTVEVETRLDAAGKLAAISQQSLGTAVDQLTAIMNTFNLSTEDSTRVVDILANESANSAISVAELGTALQPVASLAASAGMSLETTSAFITTMESTTRQSASVIGNALKTIIARFQQLKSSTDDLDDGTSANDVEEALASAGVALRDATGSFRDFDEVIMELSNKWDTLDSNTQRYIATVGAGTRQQSQFIALVSNYARNVENISTATNSAGAAQQQFQAISTNLSAALNKLDNNFIALKTSFADGINIITVATDILSSFVGLLAKMPTTVTIAITSIIGLIVRYAKLQFQIEKNIAAQVRETTVKQILNRIENSQLKTTEKTILVQKLQQGITKKLTAEELKKSLAIEVSDQALQGQCDTLIQTIANEASLVITNNGLTFSFATLTAGIKSAAIAVGQFTIALLTNPLTYVALAIAGITAGFIYLSRESERAAEKIDKLNESEREHLSTAQGYKDASDAVEEYIQRLEESIAVGEDTEEIRKEIVSSLGDEINGVDILTDSYGNLIQALQIYNKEQKISAGKEVQAAAQDEAQSNSVLAEGLNKYKTDAIYTDKNGKTLNWFQERQAIGEVRKSAKNAGEGYLSQEEVDRKLSEKYTIQYELEISGKTFYFDSYEEMNDYIAQIESKAGKADISFTQSKDIAFSLENDEQINNIILSGDALAKAIQVYESKVSAEIYKSNGQITDDFFNYQTNFQNAQKDAQDAVGISMEQFIQALGGNFEGLTQSQLDYLKDFVNTTNDQMAPIAEQFADGFDNLNEKIQKIKLKFIGNNSEFNLIDEKTAKEISDTGWIALSNAYEKGGEKFAKIIIKNMFAGLQDALKDNNEFSQIFDNILSGIDFSNFDSIEEAQEKLQSLAETLSSQKIDTGWLIEIIDGLEALQGSLNSVKGITDNLFSAMSSYDSVMKSIAEAVNKTAISQEDLNSILEYTGLTMSQLGQYLTLTADGYLISAKGANFAAEAANNKASADYDAIIASANSTIALAEQNKQTLSNAKAHLNSAKAILANAIANNQAISPIGKLAHQTNYAANEMAQLKDITGDTSTTVKDFSSMAVQTGDSLEEAGQKIEAMIAEIDAQTLSQEDAIASAQNLISQATKAKKALGSGADAVKKYSDALRDSKGGASKSTDDLTKAVEEQIGALEDYKTQLEDTKKRLEGEKKALESLNKTLKENLKLYLDLIKTRLSDEIEKQTTAVESFYDAIKNSIQSEIDAFEEKLDSLQKEADKLQSRADELQESADKEEESLNKLYNAATNYYDAVTDGIDNEIELQDQLIERNQLKIDLLEEQKSAIQEQIDNLDKAADSESKLLALEKARDALANARSQKTRLTLTNGGGWRLKTDNQAVQDAQSNLATAQKDYQKELLERQQEKLDTQISALEDQNNILAETKDSLNEQKSYIQSIKDDWETAQENLGKSTSEIEEQTRLIREFMQIDEIGRQNLLNGFVQGINSNAQSQQAAQDAANKAQLAQDELDYQSNAENAGSIQSAIKALEEQQNQVSGAQQKYFDNLLSNNAEQIAIQKQMEQLVQSMLTADIGSLEAFQVFQQQLNGAFESANEYASNQAEYINHINETIDYYTEMSERLDMTTDEINQRQAILNEINNATLASLIEGGSTFNKLDGQYQEIIRNNNQTEYIQGQIDQVSNEINDVNNQINALKEQSNQIASEAKQTSNNNTKAINNKIGSSSSKASETVSTSITDSKDSIGGKIDSFQGIFEEFSGGNLISLADLTEHIVYLMDHVDGVKTAVESIQFPQFIYPAGSRGGMLGFSNGGVDEVTRAVQVHGTKNRPELILNNSQSAALFKYIDSMTRIPTLSTAGSARNALSAFNTSNNTTNEGTSFTGCEFNIESNANNIDSLVRELKQSSPMKRN